TMVDSKPVKETQVCRFQTCYDVNIYPVSLLQASIIHKGGDNFISLRFEIEEGVNIANMGLDSIRLYLFGDSALTYTVYRLLNQQVEEIVFRDDSGGSIKNQGKLKMVGFGEDESVLQYDEHSYHAYRLLEEYFVFPEKFLFVDICGLKVLSALEVVSYFEVEIKLKTKAPAGLRLSSENFRLYCTPIVNIFPRDAEPIRLDHLNTKYRIMTDMVQPQNLEVYSVDKVEGITLDMGQRRKYEPFYSFRHNTEEDDGVYYYLTREVSPGDAYWDTYISFVSSQKNINESVSLELTCTNGNMAKKIAIGNICCPTENVPGFVKFSNITQPTPALRPELGKGLEWKFISHLALNFLSITNTPGLCTLLEIYNTGNTKANRRRIAGIVGVDAVPEQILLHGVPIRGTHIHLKLNEKHFEDEGDVLLFSSVLNEFISLYASINSFTRLTVSCTGSEVSIQWPAVTGKQEIM
ncbi:MAG: type VI secretion system baseplate subunit TssF, partial [Candidatus Desantisbacteria bacterium]